jgi:hypothetical protein
MYILQTPPDCLMFHLMRTPCQIHDHILFNIITYIKFLNINLFNDTLFSILLEENYIAYENQRYLLIILFLPADVVSFSTTKSDIN